MPVRVRLYDAATSEIVKDELRETIESNGGKIESFDAVPGDAFGYEAVADFPTEDAAQNCIDAIDHYAEHGTTVNDLLVRGFE